MLHYKFIILACIFESNFGNEVAKMQLEILNSLLTYIRFFLFYFGHVIRIMPRNSLKNVQISFIYLLIRISNKVHIS